MSFEPWILAAMEEHGYMNTNESCIRRVARYLAAGSNDTIETEEFRSACIACNVDPDSFTLGDLERLRQLPG